MSTKTVTVGPVSLLPELRKADSWRDKDPKKMTPQEYVHFFLDLVPTVSAEAASVKPRQPTRMQENELIGFLKR